MSAYPMPVSTVFYARYGTYQFPPLTETIGLSLIPHKTGDGRATKYTEWMIRLQFDIQSDTNGTTDTEALLALAQLNHTGEEFVFRGRGLGNPQINIGGLFDLKWGPDGKVENVEIRSAQRCLRVTWSVSFCIPTCPEKWYDNALPFLEIVFTVTHTPDKAGFTTRSCQGYATISNNRTAPGAVTALRSPDDYRRELVIPCMTNFHRRFKPWVVSEDRTRLDFGWDDVEMPVVLPLHVVECHMSDSIQSTKEGLASWQGTIQANYLLRRGASGLLAALHFLQEVKKITDDRNKEIVALGAPAPGARPSVATRIIAAWVTSGLSETLGFGTAAPTPPSTLTSVVIPLSFSASNPDRFGPPAASFSFGYSFCVPLAKLFQAVNLWQPVEAGKWDDWYSSLSTTAMHPYAGSGARFSVGDDYIYDPCYPQGRAQKSTELEHGVDEGGQGSLEGLFPLPPPERSWLIYQNNLTVESDTGTVELKTIPSEEPDPEDDVFGEDSDAVEPDNPFDGIMQAITDLQGPTLVIESVSSARNDTGTTPTTPPAGSFRRSTPSCVAYLRGFAARVGYPIPCPLLKEVGGVVAEPASRPDMGEGFSTGTVANVVHTIHIASWNLRYLLPSVPNGPILPPKNPTLGN